MYWELWDTRSKNLVETFDAEDEALQGVRDLLAVNRADLIDDLVLGAAHDEGESREVPLPPALTGAELRSRLAQTAAALTADDATRAVHERIRRWLAEEGWTVDRVPDQLSDLNVMVTLNTRQRINIFQRREHIDHITVALHAIFVKPVPTEDVSLSLEVQKRLLRHIERDALLKGVDFQRRGLAPIEAQFSTFIYFDSLNKDRLIEKIRLVLEVVTLSVLSIANAIEVLGGEQEGAEKVEEIDLPDNVLVFPVQQAAAV